ncbi:MAG TPA: hypothetical protein VHF05_01845 [Candidatus Paceibacterota bacterium]|jgi:HD superfamily phosphohydrolase|nr:hypothetical protein [Candidatus Paceibacterota bacterium]
MTRKTIPSSDPLSIIKSIVDSDIDADRIDFVRRDGQLAGGEYGHYDIRRLCDSAFIERDENGWFLAYSEKALTSMEALLYDRYRTHVWIHFHHSVIAMKMLVRFLIQKAFEQGMITKESFSLNNIHSFALRDDIWLWNILRGLRQENNTTFDMIKRAVFYREKENTLNLWKMRTDYHEIEDAVKSRARVNAVDYGIFDFYIHNLEVNTGVKVFSFPVKFTSISKREVPLYSESSKKLTGKSLLKASKIVSDIETMMKDEPQQFFMLVGENARAHASKLRQDWIDLTARWVNR